MTTTQQGTHWKEQLAGRGDHSTEEWLSRVKDDARRGGCGNGGGAQPGAQPRAQLPPIQIDDLGAKLSFDLRMIGWARIIHQRITWLALLVWLARLPIRLPLRGAFWIGRQWLKWRIRRYAERGIPHYLGRRSRRLAHRVLQRRGTELRRRSRRRR